VLDFFADFRYGCRILLKSPAFAAIAILGAGIGDRRAYGESSAQSMRFCCGSGIAYDDCPQITPP
jgi:hypothetical protein